MKKSKKILSAVAAIAVLSTTTGIYAFANTVAEQKKEAAETATSASAEVVSEEAETAEEVTAEAETAEEAKEAAETSEEETAADSEAADVAEDIAADEKAKPEKPIGIREAVEKTFDLENEDFVDDDAKAEWFDLCTNKFLAKPAAPVDEANKPNPPVPAEDENRPEPPAPAEDENRPEPPAPPVVDDANKPEPPAKPVGVREMIEACFDFEKLDFVDDEAKADWFDFCINTLLAAPKAPVAPEKKDDVKPEPPTPPVVDDANKPEPPALVDDENRPEPPAPPVHDEANKPVPPVAPIHDDANKPEPPVKLQPPVKPGEAQQTEETEDAADETEIVSEEA